MLPELHRPAHQRAPGKRQSKNQLRPVGDTLHERIGCDHDERAKADEDGETVELQQYGEPRQRLQHQERPGLPAAHLARGQRPRTCALDLGIDLLIDEVVVGAAGAAHGDGADEKQRERQGRRQQARQRVTRPGVGAGCECRRPPARPQQQLPADGPVPACELGIGPQRARQQTIDPMPARRIGDPALARTGLYGFHCHGVAAQAESVKPTLVPGTRRFLALDPFPHRQ